MKRLATLDSLGTVLSAARKQGLRLPLWSLLCALLLGCEDHKQVPPSAEHRERLASPLELLPTNPILRHIDDANVHPYFFTLGGDRYISITMEQQGVEVAAALFDPRGQEVVSVDHPLTESGTENIVWITKLAGTYRLEVRSVGPPGSGTYGLRLEPPRVASVQDRARASAMHVEQVGRALERDQRWQAAAKEYETSLSLLARLEDSGRIAVIQVALARVYRQLGLLEKAAELLLEAQVSIKEVGDSRREAVVLSELGVVRTEQGRPSDAALAFETALEQWKVLAQPVNEGVIHHNLGRLYLRLGRTDTARHHFQRALLLAQQTGDSGREARALSDLGDLYVQSTRLSDGEKLLRAALQIRERLGDSGAVAETLTTLAALEVERGEFAEAEALLKEATGWTLRNGNTDVQARSLSGLGEVHMLLGSPGQAVENFDKALVLLRHGREPILEASCLYGLARARRTQGKLASARADVEEALAIIEGIGASRYLPSDGGDPVAIKRQYYDLLISILIDLHFEEPHAGFAAQAFEASERSRMGDRREGRCAPATLSAAGERRRERELWHELEDLEVQRLRFQDSPYIEDRMKAVLEELSWERTRNCIESTEASAEGQWTRLSDAQSLLDPDTILVEYFLGEERSLRWTVTPDSLALATLPPRKEIEGLADRFYELTAKVGVNPHLGLQQSHVSAQLSRVLLGAAGDYMGFSRIVVVTDGALAYLPFAALSMVEPGRPSTTVISNYELVQIPSTNYLRTRREITARRPRPKSTLAVFADPIFEIDDERLPPNNGGSEGSRSAGDLGIFRRLPSSVVEARFISQLVSDEKILLAVGEDASLDGVRAADLEDYSILHFATHAVVNESEPGLSYLVLSGFDARGLPRPAFLWDAQLRSSDFKADLVVLSASRTALGRGVRGEGVSSLASAFLDGGAARVIATLWSVDDRATAELMSKFYRRLIRNQESPSEALREAQLAMMQDSRWKSPYYWAGFVFVGDWKWSDSERAFLQEGSP